MTIIGLTKLLILLLVFSSMVLPTQTLSSDHEHPKSSSTIDSIGIHQEPNENASQPLLIVQNQSPIELGDEIVLFYGMNHSDIFIEGYNYSLYLIRGNNFDIINFNATLSNVTLLESSLSRDFISTLSYNTLGGAVPKLSPTNYTFLYQINSTSRGILNAFKSFEIVTLPGAVIDSQFRIVGQPAVLQGFEDLDINETIQVEAIIFNIGARNAFNISVSLSQADDSINTSNITLPGIINVIQSTEEFRFNFTISMKEFGEAEIKFLIQYTDGIGQTFSSNPGFLMRATPQFSGSIGLDFTQVIYLNEDDADANSVPVFLTYLGIHPLDGLSITITLTSDGILFIQDRIGFNEAISDYEFLVFGVTPGPAEILVTLEFVDVSNEREFKDEIFEADFTITDSKPQNGGNGFSLGDTLLVMAIVLYTTTIIAFGILWFNPDLRRTILTKIFGAHFIPDLTYHTNKIIVDGSNVAWESVTSAGKPKISNIKRALKVLKSYGFEEVTVVADAALRYQIEEKKNLDKETRRGKIKVLPAKVEADEFILRLSAKTGALILTNDLYKEFREQFPWIDKRRVPYSIIKQEFYLHPIFEEEENKSNS